MVKLLFVLLKLFAVFNLIYSECPTIVTRAEWNARPPKSKKPLSEIPPPFVVVHHSDTRPCNSSSACKKLVKGIQNYHMDNREWTDIGYNFLVGGDGNVYEGRGWGIWGAHVPKYNSKSIGICLIGNFMEEKPPKEQLEVLENLISCAKQNNYVTADYQLIGHRQGSKTSCPGNKLFNEIETWPHFASNIPPV